VTRALFGYPRKLRGVVRRISLVGLALIACSLVVAVAVAPAGAATSKAKKVPKRKTVKIHTTCTSNVSIAVPAGQNDVVPPVDQGLEYGSVSCPKVGSGVESETLLLDDSGNLTGKYTKYFPTGSVHGTYALTPGDSLPSGPTTFDAATYTGTETVTAGTGIYKHVVGKGTLTCSTPDSVHLSCREQLKLTLPPVLA
jgi:hypothetical protein